VEAVQMLECGYNYQYNDKSGCYHVFIANLSKYTTNEKFTFSGTEEQKKNAGFIAFVQIGRVAHVPLNLVEEFPKLSELRIYDSEIPIVKNNLLGPQLSWIETLELFNNKIQIVEEGAFKQLHNLWSISLSRNEIKTISAKIFQNNRKLKRIYLEKNKIKKIAPETFQSLNRETRVDLRGNDECVDLCIGGCWRALEWDERITEIDSYLLRCYENHKKSSNLLIESEKNISL
jgi:Leucine-rich repeat (LRR) protein